MNNGTDVLLTDRINYYYNNNETVCQSNCQLSYYLMESQYMKCECDIANSEINIQETSKFNPKIIYNSFYSILKYSNYKVLYCYKLAFSIYSITKNIGSIIIIIYFIFYCIFLIIYITKEKNHFNLKIMKAFNQYLYKKEFVKKNQFINNKIQSLNKKKY